jgi:hypothetical protein
MQSLEQTLLQVRQRLRNMLEDGFLVSYRPIAEPARAHVEAGIERILAEIAVIGREFDVQTSTEDLGAYVIAQMAVASAPAIWGILMDGVPAILLVCVLGAVLAVALLLDYAIKSGFADALVFLGKVK